MVTEAPFIVKAAVTGPRKPGPPKVTIVGAGLGGLMMAALLERIKVPYLVFERAREVKPLGAAISLNANILAVFEQLGLLQELIDISLPLHSMDMYKANMKKVGGFDIKAVRDIVGYDYLMMSRPKLYQLLQSQVPSEKILMGRKVLSIQQNKEGVMIRCSDNSTHHSDILIGADGAYSAVRQSLYSDLKDREELPESDKENFVMGHICMVGTTDPLNEKEDEETFKEFRQHQAFFRQVVGKGDSAYSWSLITVPEGRICWSVVKQIVDVKEGEDKMFRNSEWTPESNAEMVKEVEAFLMPIGDGLTTVVLGDLIRRTPRGGISKVFLEEKLFKTWHHGRTVLVGDACHKILPSNGQGAVNAMQDAVILANCIYEMGQNVTLTRIRTAFEDYQSQRMPHVMEQFNVSKMNAKFMYGQRFTEKILRHIIFHWIPESAQQKNLIQSTAYRPQVSFLPYPDHHGICPILPQKVSERYAEEQAVQKKKYHE